LADGQLALTIDLAAGHQLQAWRLEPRTGGLTQLLSDVAGVRLAVAPDASRVAYVGYDVGPAATSSIAGGALRPGMVWLAGSWSAGERTGWRAPLADNEHLRDASWSPLADRLLVISDTSQPSGSLRSRLWLLDAATLQAREILTLPSEVVPGSTLWSPDGSRVAFLAHAGLLNALCMLELDGGFRYLADLELTNGQPLAYPAAAWSNDSQRLVFVAPRQGPPGAPIGSLQSDTKRAIYVATTTDTAPTLVGEADIDGLTWREDGQLVGVSRQSTDGALDLRVVGTSGNGIHLLDLPVQPTRGYAAAWDMAHARLLIANSTSSGAVDYWVALLGLEDNR
jgi:dipeptidyl aminopeptidase/acylaminoacyl peptidase